MTVRILSKQGTPLNEIENEHKPMHEDCIEVNGKKWCPGSHDPLPQYQERFPGKDFGWRGCTYDLPDHPKRAYSLSLLRKRRDAAGRLLEVKLSWKFCWEIRSILNEDPCCAKFPLDRGFCREVNYERVFSLDKIIELGTQYEK